MKLQLKMFLRTLCEILTSMAHRFNEDRCFRVASALSFTTMLALVPLFTVVLSMLSVFPVFEQWSGELEAFIFQNFVPTAGDAVQEYLHEFSASAGKLTAVGLVFLLVSSLFLLATIEDSFNDIWRVRSGRTMLQRLLVYWAVLTLGPLMLVISLSMSSALFSMSFFSSQPLVAGLTGMVLRYLPLLLEFGAFILFYSVIPNCEVRLRDAVTGALVATILFELAKFGFAFYILNFNSYEVIYGALATIPIFLFWIYLSWLVLLIGALLTAVLGDRYIKSDTK